MFLFALKCAEKIFFLSIENKIQYLRIFIYINKGEIEAAK